MGPCTSHASRTRSIGVLSPHRPDLDDGQPSLLAAFLAAAVLEEIVFRAGLQEALLRWQARATAPRALRSRLLGCSVPNVATAALFALAHAATRSWWVGLGAFPSALALGWLYERHRRLWPCIALHAAFNLCWFFLAPLLRA